jgi:membrane protease YdiL (CAAX protease family)
MESLVTVATFDFRANAEVAKFLLEQSGIRTFLADDNLVGVDWFLSNAVGGVKLQVAAADVKRAGEILQRAQPAKAETEGQLPEEDITFACQECGKKITFPGERRGHVETCPECGSYIDVPHRTEPAFVAGPGDAQQPKTPDAAARTTGQLWIEVSAVLCLAYLPALYGALVPADSSVPRGAPSVGELLYRLLWAVRVSFPLLVIIALTKDRWSLFGIVRPRWFADLFIGCVVWVCDILVCEAARSLVPLSMFAGQASPHAADHRESLGMAAGLLFVTATIVSSFSQELVYRGYLIPRFERLFRSTWLALLVTTAMFASYHAYQGANGVIGAAASGLVWAIAFCLCRRLWPLCVAHALHNVMLLCR